jgi:N-acetylneuraminic acid mutarotase
MCSVFRRALVWTAVLALLSLTGSAWAQPAVPVPRPAPGRWGLLAPVPEKSEEFTFCDVNGKIYLIGGLPVDTTPPLGVVQEYDTATDTWTKKKNMPLATHHAAPAAYNGRIYLFGGQIQARPGGPAQLPINNAWEYNPASDSWRALAPMPTARTAAAAAEVGGKIYVFAGASVHPGQPLVSLSPDVPHRSLDTVEVYDPATNTWASRGPAPTARNHAAIGVVSGKIYLIGGRVGSANITAASNTNVVEVYDPATDTWGAVGMRMPIARSGMGWATRDGKIYVAGGELYDRHFFAVVRAVHVYDPATNSWGALPQMPTARHGVNVAIVGNRLYVIGGHVQAAGVGGGGANADDNEVYEFPK